MSRTSKGAVATAQTARSGPQSRNPRTIAVLCGLLLLVTAVFAQTARFDFVNFDDSFYILGNPQVTAGLTREGAARAFTTAGPSGEWYPLTMLSHMLDVQLFGLQAGPHHLTNVLFHAGGTLVLFLAFLRLTSRVWPSAVVAALFAIHPLHVESVAWLAERRDVLSGFFFMLTLWAYAGYAHRRSWLRYALVAVFFACGLMAKPIVVTLPVILLLMDYWPLRRFEGDWKRARRLVIEKMPLFALAAAVAVITLLTHPEGDATIDRVAQLSVGWRVANGVVSCAKYLVQFVYPAALVPHYPHPGTSLPIWQILVSLVVLAVMTAGAFLWRRRHPYLLVGWLWYLVMLLPVIGLIQVGSHAMADRYTYLSHIGLYISLAWAAAYAADVSAVWRRMVTSVAVAAVAILAVMAWKQTSYWRDSETLWTHALGSTSPNPITDFNYGLAMDAKGNTSEAMTYYERALSLDPNYVQAHNTLAILLATEGRTQDAIGHLERALTLAPGYATTYNNLATTLARAGRTDEAIVRYREAIRVNPNVAKTHQNLGDLLAAEGRVDEAASQFEQAIALDGRLAAAYSGLALTLSQRGRTDDAIANFEHALALDPQLAAAHFYLGLELYRKGRVAEAVDRWREAIRIEPGGVTTLAGTAWTMATSQSEQARNGAEAVALAQLAVELSGTRDPALLDILAAAQAEAGQFERAVATATEAAQLASRRGDTQLEAAVQERLKLYRSDRPFHHAS